MVKRTLVGLAWFMSAGWGLNLLSVFSGMPAVLSIPIAAAIALFFAVDPLGVIWTGTNAARDSSVPEPETRYGGAPEPLVRSAL